VLGRTEAFARNNPPLPSMVDAFGNGLGYSLVLIVIGGVRELFGTGKLFGDQVLPLAIRRLVHAAQPDAAGAQRPSSCSAADLGDPLGPAEQAEAPSTPARTGGGGAE
jgi:Na+-transporting NADH:ubiquinone oxidoreductase subunit NqrD